VIRTQDPKARLMCEEVFGPVLTVYVYPDPEYQETLRLCDETSPYALTGAVFAQDRAAIVQAMRVLRQAAGNFYVNDKPTGAVVGQQPFGGSRASGTNDKAGSAINLLRWVSPRAIRPRTGATLSWDDTPRGPKGGHGSPQALGPRQRPSRAPGFLGMSRKSEYPNQIRESRDSAPSPWTGMSNSHPFHGCELLVATVTRRIGGFLSGRADSNCRPHGPEPCALPNCATPRIATVRHSAAGAREWYSSSGLSSGQPALEARAAAWSIFARKLDGC
jgi:hypothetical protein